MRGGPSRPDRPEAELSAGLAQALAGPRSRALRRARIGQRQRVLEVGPGWGYVTAELLRRAAGEVVALDRHEPALGSLPPGALGVGGDLCCPPFRDRSFDLVFLQNVLLWTGAEALRPVQRLLQPGGCVVALEPDFGGMMEHPALGLREVWLAALARAGADPLVGRKLAGVCEELGWETWVELAHLPQPAEEGALQLLEGLPLADDERSCLREARAVLRRGRGRWGMLLHLPYFLIVAAAE